MINFDISNDSFIIKNFQMNTLFISFSILESIKKVTLFVITLLKNQMMNEEKDVHQPLK